LSIIRTPITVRFSDLDPYHHVNHSVFLNYFEVGRFSLLESKNISLKQLQEQGFQMVVSEVHIKYLAPITREIELFVETEVLKRRRVSTIWSQRLVADNKVYSTAEITIVTTNLEGKVARLPDNLANLLL